jgi:hypothetical protein
MVLIFSSTALANADTYKWVDNQGVVNFTDNLDAVPRKYRSKVKVTPSVDTSASAPSQEKAGKIVEPDKKTEGPASTPGHPEGAKLYGGHDERWWKSSYASLRGELKSLQDNLPAKRDDLEKLRRKLVLYTYTRNRIAYQDKLAEVQRDEERIKVLTDQLTSLDTQAATAGVPFDWRQ